MPARCRPSYQLKTAIFALELIDQVAQPEWASYHDDALLQRLLLDSGVFDTPELKAQAEGEGEEEEEINSSEGFWLLREAIQKRPSGAVQHTT